MHSHLHHCHTCRVDSTYVMCVCFYTDTIHVNIYIYMHTLISICICNYIYRILDCLYLVIPIPSLSPLTLLPCVGHGMGFAKVRAMTELATKCKLVATSVVSLLLEYQLQNTVVSSLESPMKTAKKVFLT